MRNAIAKLAYLVSGTLLVLFTNCAVLAQEDTCSDEESLRQALRRVSPEYEETVKLFTLRGTEAPYKDMLRKWIAKFGSSGVDSTVAGIVAVLKDPELLAAATIRLQELERAWPASARRIERLCEELFVKVDWPKVVPHLEAVLEKPLPKSVFPSFHYAFCDTCEEFRAKVAVCEALARQKGREVLPVVRRQHQAFLDWVGTVRSETAERGMYDTTDYFDGYVHDVRWAFESLIARLGWDEERPRYVKMALEQNAYDRWRALSAFALVKDKTVIRYIIPLLDDLREVFIPLSEATLRVSDKKEYNKKPSPDVLGGRDGPFLMESLSMLACIVLEVLTGQEAFLDPDGSVAFRPIDARLEGNKIHYDEVILRQAWKKWWIENMYNPDYNE